MISRPNTFEIDIDAIGYNLRHVRRAIGRTTAIFAALKANAYGFGIREVGKAVVSFGADGIALVDLDDAIVLRHEGVRLPILLYGGVLPDADVISAVTQYRLMPTILDLKSARMFSAHAKSVIRFFAKVDVGLERLGLPPDETLTFIEKTIALPHLELHGIYTHLHVPLGAPAEYLEWQLERFGSAMTEINARGVPVKLRMALSTAVIDSAPGPNLNAVDPGQMLFGITPAEIPTIKPRLRPAFHALKSRLIQVRDVVRTEFMDSAPFRLRPGMRVGVISMGKIDGISSLTCGRALVCGRRVSILGEPTLEHTRLDLTDVPTAQSGDEVVLIGRQGSAEISLRDVTAYQMSSELELVLGIRESVNRVYLRRTRANGGRVLGRVSA